MAARRRARLVTERATLELTAGRLEAEVRQGGRLGRPRRTQATVPLDSIELVRFSQRASALGLSLGATSLVLGATCVALWWLVGGGVGVVFVALASLFVVLSAVGFQSALSDQGGRLRIESEETTLRVAVGPDQSFQLSSFARRLQRALERSQDPSSGSPSSGEGSPSPPVSPLPRRLSNLNRPQR